MSSTLKVKEMVLVCMHHFLVMITLLLKALSLANRNLYYRQISPLGIGRLWSLRAMAWEPFNFAYPLPPRHPLLRKQIAFVVLVLVVVMVY